MAWTQMSRGKQFAIGFAIFGMAITAVFFAYLELSDPCNRSEILEWVLSVLCPPSVLSLFLVDIFLDQHSINGFIGWFIIGLLNSGLYAAIGVVVERYLWRSGRPTTNQGIPLH
jgi:hypothetical protein